MAIDFEEVANYFIDAIADRVVEKLRAADGSNWPGPVETKEERSAEDLAARYRSQTGEEPPESMRTVESYDEIDTRKAERIAALEGLGADKVKELLKAAGEDLRAYKVDLFTKAADFEILSGSELDDATEADLAEPEAEDAEPEPLTREAALELDLAELKAVAVDAGLEESELKGLDVDAIVDLLFGEEASDDEVLEDGEVREPNSEDLGGPDEEEVELTEAEIRDASLGQLKEWATEFGLEYARSISRNDLIELILSDEE